jgi:dipeptidyl aminopeptidase/acylaminoacyl peptidase
MKFLFIILINFLSLSFMIKNENFGSWKSLVTTDLIVKDSVKFLNIIADGEDIYLSEIRTQEKGRSTILKFEDSEFKEVLPKIYNARTRVHEYGGLSFKVFDKEIYFSNFEDQRIYKKNLLGKISPITPISKDRYVEYTKDKLRDLIYCVQEEHLEKEVNNAIVKIDKKGNVKKIAEGRDFFSSIVISPDCKKLAFLAWDQPNMPWDAATLYIAEITTEGDLTNLKKIAGSDNEAVFQPRWGNDGYLYFVSDKTNYWNLYRYKDELTESIYPMDAEFGQPMWLFGMSTYDFYIKDDKLKIVATYTKNGSSHLVLIDPDKKNGNELKTKFTSFSSILVVNDKVFFIGASPTELSSVAVLNLKNYQYQILKKSKEILLDSGYISLPQNIEFPSENNLTAHMIFYPPKNKDYQVSKKQKPPLIVRSHGGPTGQAEAVLNLEIQFWTSRGFAFADVNYSGSTGYGREYRQRLYGNWGIVDVDDCINAALYLAKNNLIDENKMIIKGGSAGGYTTLCALAFRDIFKAGASYYGVSDLIALVKESHKFEEKYEEKLIGPFPEKKEIYFERSPINFIENLKCPVILFQGEDDKIVPPNQSEMMFKALKEKKLPTAYLLFEKEGHGFRSAEAIKKSIEAELYFYSKIFDFSLKDNIEPIEIYNLK